MNSKPRPIGGFFELEIPAPGPPVHPKAVSLSTGRSCLCAILEYLKPAKCYLPHYTCDATLEPFHQAGVTIAFYQLDAQLRPVNSPDLKDGECFVLTNYWGLQRELAETFSDLYGDRLIVDDTHDFNSHRRYPGSWSFTSARKYFGVPDGAFLYLPDGVNTSDVVPETTGRFHLISLDHSINRLLGRQAEAFAQYQAYEAGLPCALQRISSYSEALLSALDMPAMFARRRENFQLLSDALDASNRFEITLSEAATPFVYPYLPGAPLAKAAFHQEQIFVPTLWPDVLQRPDMTCKTAAEYTENLIPFPIDHRYGEPEMQRIIDVTRTLENQP